ncbi:O-antigen ligase family protein [Haladaptatus sp. GCM10025707]|uniref:O-antigen ligase family protein n=1 Tax=unclassified Haladaptatus TaxID=2622732 RepID=UPI0023E858CD|nr:O-antigen ligase family protein [Haladaptatus sp. QDMS2]
MFISEMLSSLRRTDGSVDPLRLALSLLVALTVFVPAIGIGLQTALAVPYPLLLLTGLVGASYTVVVWYKGELVVGSAVAVVILSMFNAEVPLTRPAALYPGNVVGDVVLVQVPLALLTCLILWKGTSRSMLVAPTLTFGAFTVWSLMSALLGAGPNTAIALSFALYLSFGVATLVTFSWVVRDGQLPFRTLLIIFVGSVMAHVGVAIAQLLNQGTFGLTRLGEGADAIIATATVPLVGEVGFGTFVSGFTGMSFHLANLIVLMVPMFIALAYRTFGFRLSLGVFVLVAFGLVRATTTDAGRGGLMVAVVGFTLFVAWAYFDVIKQHARAPASKHLVKPVFGWVGAILASIPLLVYPSSATSQSSHTKVENPVKGNPSNGGVGGETTRLDVLLEQLSSMSIPFFDLSNLGVRVQQYLVGFDLFFQYPLFGIGGMNYVLMANEYGVPSRPGADLPYPIHNIYITVLVETGFIGFAFYTLTIGLVMLYGLRLLRDPATDRLLVAGVMGGLLGSLGFAFWDIFQLYSVVGFIPFWLLAGGLVGEYLRVQPSSSVSTS